MRWRIYYWTPETGAEVVTSEDQDWAEAPADGVQVVMYDEGTGWTLAHGQEEPYEIPSYGEVKHGSLAPDDAFNRILKQAYANVGIERGDL